MRKVVERLTSEENRVSSVELEILTDEEVFSVSGSLFASFGGRKRQKTFMTMNRLMINGNHRNLTSTGQPPPFANKSREPNCVFFIGVRNAIPISQTLNEFIASYTHTIEHKETFLLVHSNKGKTPYLDFDHTL